MAAFTAGNTIALGTNQSLHNSKMLEWAYITVHLNSCSRQDIVSDYTLEMVQNLKFCTTYT